MELALEILTWSVLIIAVCLVILVASRFFTLRSRGASVLLRKLPANGVHGWRHGVMCYSGEYAEYYKLRSVSPSADLRLNRLDIEVLGHRAVSDDEATFISEGTRALHIRVGSDEYEVAFDLHSEMAFNAWVESAPSKRQERVDYRHLKQRALKKPQNDSSQWPKGY